MFGVRSFAATTFASTGNDENFIIISGNELTASIGDVTIAGVAEQSVIQHSVETQTLR
jgi:hypothetical protein